MPTTQKHWRSAAKLGAEYGFTFRTSSGRNAHGQLVRPGHRPVAVPSSPRSEGGMLELLRTNLRRSVREAAERNSGSGR